jgi:serine/threonine protein kinase
MERLHTPNSDAPYRKYVIDCSTLIHDQRIFIGKTIKEKEDIRIIEAFLKSSSTQTQYYKKKHLVLKIGPSTKTIKKEYNISERLSDIPGFINAICIHTCLDTHETSGRLCTGKQGDEWRSVLVLPYLKDGSMESFQWSDSNLHIMKSLLKQIICSCWNAFELHGFIHNDLHLNNIMLKKTTKKNVSYKTGGIIETNGFLAKIIDFDRSFIDVERKSGLEIYWRNLQNIFERLHFDLNQVVIDIQPISNMIATAVSKKTDSSMTIRLLTLVDGITMKTAQKPVFVPYNPNVYG